MPGTGAFTFPFKQHNDKVNFTLEGVRGEYRYDAAADPSVFGEPADSDSPVEVTPRESGDEVGVTPRPESARDPTIHDAPVESTETGDHPGYRYDSLGRKYPCDEYGHRIVAGSRRPKGIPPDVWKGLNSKEKARIFPRVTRMKDTLHPLRMALEYLLTTGLRSRGCLLMTRSPGALRSFRSGSGVSTITWTR